MTPGKTWRLLAHHEGQPVELRNVGRFDELVVDQWFHMEQMNERAWWIGIGDWHINISIDRKGKPTVSFWEDGKK